MELFVLCICSLLYIVYDGEAVTHYICNTYVCKVNGKVYESEQCRTYFFGRFVFENIFSVLEIRILKISASRSDTNEMSCPFFFER